MRSAAGRACDGRGQRSNSPIRDRNRLESRSAGRTCTSSTSRRHSCRWHSNRPDGGRDVTDFDWPECGAFGEFDGRGKYLKEEFTRGRSIQEIVMLEKERENRIRKHRPFGARWDWPIAMNPRLLRSELLQAGLRPVR